MTRPSLYQSAYDCLEHHITCIRCLRNCGVQSLDLSVENLSDTWIEELVSLQKEKSSDFERQNTRGKLLINAPDEYKNYYIHTKMMKFETLLKTSGERNLRSINLTHGGY